MKSNCKFFTSFFGNELCIHKNNSSSYHAKICNDEIFKQCKLKEVIKMKIEQIAFAAKNPQEIMEEYSALGIDEWSHDIVEANGNVFGKPCFNKAELHFNYQLGYELEIIKYLNGTHWHMFRNDGNERIFLSHKGMHVDQEEMNIWKKKMTNQEIAIIQEVHTFSHTNPVIAGKRKYHYVVFDSIEKLGFDLKLIRRIDI